MHSHAMGTVAQARECGTDPQMTMSRDATAGRSAGFTLVELLIVLAVLSLLMTLIVPTVRRGAAIARRTSCAKKLGAICEAYHVRVVIDDFGADIPFDVNLSWPILIRSQIGMHPLAFFCVEDIAPRNAHSLPRLERRWDGRIEEGVPLELFDAEPVWEEMPLSALGTGGPGVWKVNEEVYNSLSLQQGVSQIDSLPQYEPGDDPNVFYMLINDEGSAGGDADYEDLILKVESEPDGTVDITCVSLGYTVFTHDFYGPLLEVRDVGKAAGALWTFESHGQISYGMTSYANRKGFSTRTVLALDYKQNIVRPDLDDPATEWDEFQAPRHLGKCNVVFADGSVEAMAPEEINPADAEVRHLLWEPGR